MHPAARTQSAFSLVELSIVLVILGLLIGGVLSGRSLIRAAELRSVSSEYSKYMASIQAFRDKYFAYPGDMNSATRFWGRLNSNADCVTNSSASVASPGACDGDGDGIMDSAGAASQAGETEQFWLHLAHAGLIEGTYTGLAGSGGYAHCPIGTSCPASKLAGAGWGIRYLGNYAGNAAAFSGNYGNFFDYGAGVSTQSTYGAALNPSEVWNVDMKIDDGVPGTGKLIVYNWPSCTNAASLSDTSTTYKLTSSSIVCSLSFLQIL